MANFSIMQERDFPLLNRKSFLIKAEFIQKPTPTNADIKKNIATFLKTEETRIAVKQIKQGFGMGTAEVTVYVYKDEKSLKAIEEIKKKKKPGAQESGKETEAKK